MTTTPDTAGAIQRLADDYADLLKKAGPHRWGMLTVENALAEAAALREALRNILLTATQLPPPCGPGMAHVDLDVLRAAMPLVGWE